MLSSHTQQLSSSLSAAAALPHRGLPPSPCCSLLQANVLSRQLQGWLDDAKKTAVETERPVKAIIAPSAPHGIHSLAPTHSHAGYSYSGPTAAYAYRYLLSAAPSIRRIFILGPSHHHYTRIAELSSHAAYSTPLRELQLDLPTIAELKSKGGKALFSSMSVSTDEDEHSIEMHLPFIAHCMTAATQPFTIVPILVGSMSSATELALARLLLPHFLSPSSFFVVSSDFCHWGARFSFSPLPPPSTPPLPIHAGIEAMDRRGMELIAKGDVQGWDAYLAQTGNTICGRHPIGVLMRVVDEARKGEAGGAAVDVSVRWVRYAQSSRVERQSESSVSYASAIFFLDRQQTSTRGDDAKADR